MKKIIFAGIILILALMIYAYLNNFYSPKISFDGQPVFIDVAITPSQITRGLSSRPMMKNDHGMLFVFANRDYRPFWMKDMKFPLDFVWLDGTRVVDLTRNVPILTDGTWTVIRPNAQVDRVLEVNAGTIDRLHITTASSVKYNK
jgi:uncharacterized membrane protein (UPF0127 family)